MRKNSKAKQFHTGNLAKLKRERSRAHAAKALCGKAQNAARFMEQVT